MFNVLVFAILSLSANEVLMKVDSVANVPHSIGLMEETITTTSGRKRTFKIRYYAKDGMEKQLMVYVCPNLVKGTGFLMVGDEIWAYFPETGRTRKIASHAKRSKIMGFDFTYEDMSINRYSEKFKAVSMKTTDKSFILTVVSKKGSVTSSEYASFSDGFFLRLRMAL